VINSVQIYVSDFGTHLLAPDSPFLSMLENVPLRRDGGWDLRYKAGRVAAAQEAELAAKIKAAWDRGEDVQGIMA
jgi:hypothetical protein